MPRGWLKKERDVVCDEEFWGFCIRGYEEVFVR